MGKSIVIQKNYNRLIEINLLLEKMKASNLNLSWNFGFCSNLIQD